MLVEFRTKGFKNFKDEICLKLNETNNYEFNTNAVKDGVVKAALIYGINASGKTNLGNAIFDIVIHLTDNNYNIDNYFPYLNLDQGEFAEFYYKFVFGGSTLEYSYKKRSPETVLEECVCIDSEEVIKYNRSNQKPNTVKVALEGTESLDTNLGDTNISFVKYVARSTVLQETNKNTVFKKFMSFVNRMLFFSSLERNQYQGFMTGSWSIENGIIKYGKLGEFQDFLAKNEIVYSLEEIDEKEHDRNKIFCRFGKGSVNFFEVASQGTKSLSLFFHWLIHFEKVSFVFIDEFDAFYHSDVARCVVEIVRDNKNLQGILTTHNTDIMTNDLLRPDCYFTLSDGKLTSFADATPKELRKAHNLQKMYKAGAFSLNG